MSKAVKRQATSNLTENSASKFSKCYDLNLITKDVSMLESFNDFIDSDHDVIFEYLTSHDFNDFLNYFKSYHLYKTSQFALVFKVSADILMRIAGDLNEKHSLAGQNFADLFVEKYRPIVHEYLRGKNSKSAAKSCIKFVTGLILQGPDVALKIATSFNLFKSSFSKQLFIRSVNDDDVHTHVLNCFGAFFVLGSNVVIRKLCENKSFIGLILRDLRFDKFDNVQLVIEILHDKIIKNSAISKIIKVKLFNVINLNHLLAVYDWKGEAQNYDEFKRLTDVDERCALVRSQVHELMLDICSNHFGVAFSDNLCGQLTSHGSNKTLRKLITSGVLNDFFTSTLKEEVLKTILRSCPDLIATFVEYLATLMQKIVPESRVDALNVAVQCYQLTSNDRIDSVLTESLKYMDGEKFVDVAILFCAPTKSLAEVVSSTRGISDECSECLSSLRESLKGNCERVLTWISVSESFESPEQRQKMKDKLQLSLTEVIIWDQDYTDLFSKDFNDKTIFKKETTKNETHLTNDDAEFEDEIDEEMRASVDALTLLNASTDMANTVDGGADLKKCLKHFTDSPFTSIRVSIVVAHTMCKGKVLLKKKQRRKLFDVATNAAVITEYWCNTHPLDTRKELIRNCIFDIVVACVDDSKSLMTAFYERVHPIQLLSVYGGTLSHVDQKIFYLLSIHQLYETAVPAYDLKLFGSSINEHYHLGEGMSPFLWRPIIESQCFNLLIDERMAASISHFPVERRTPISDQNKIHLDKSQPTLYDPCFLLEWLLQMLTRSSAEQQFLIGDYVPMKTLYSKRVIHFLVVCQSSQSSHIRLASRLLLETIVERLDDFESDVNDTPMKMQIQMILYHMFNSMSANEGQPNTKLPSVFTNLYARMLLLLDTPAKKMFSPLWEMIITKESFDLKYVPEFLFLVYCDKEDYRTRQLWCLQLLSDSVKDYDDFRVLLNTKVLMHLTCLFPTMESRAKKVTLSLMRSCAEIPKAAQTLRKTPGFLTWLNLTLWSKRDRESRQGLSEVVEAFLRSLEGSSGVVELEQVLRMNL